MEDLTLMHITTKSGYLKYHGTKPRLPPSFFTLFLRFQACGLFEAFQVTNLRGGRRPVLFGRQESANRRCFYNVKRGVYQDPRKQKKGASK